MLLNFGGLYQFEAILRPLAYADRLIIAFVTTLLFLLAAAFSLKITTGFSRIWVIAFATSATFGTLLARSITAAILRQLEMRHVFARNVVLLGAGAQVERLLGHLKVRKPRFVNVLGVFTTGVIAEANSQFPLL